MPPKRRKKENIENIKKEINIQNMNDGTYRRNIIREVKSIDDADELIESIRKQMENYGPNSEEVKNAIDFIEKLEQKKQDIQVQNDIDNLEKTEKAINEIKETIASNADAIHKDYEQTKARYEMLEEENKRFAAEMMKKKSEESVQENSISDKDTASHKPKSYHIVSAHEDQDMVDTFNTLLDEKGTTISSILDSLIPRKNAETQPEKEEAVAETLSQPQEEKKTKLIIKMSTTEPQPQKKEAVAETLSQPQEEKKTKLKIKMSTAEPQPQKQKATAETLQKVKKENSKKNTIDNSIYSNKERKQINNNYARKVQKMSDDEIVYNIQDIDNQIAQLENTEANERDRKMFELNIFRHVLENAANNRGISIKQEIKRDDAKSLVDDMIADLKIDLDEDIMKDSSLNSAINSQPIEQQPATRGIKELDDEMTEISTKINQANKQVDMAAEERLAKLQKKDIRQRHSGQIQQPIKRELSHITKMRFSAKDCAYYVESKNNIDGNIEKIPVNIKKSKLWLNPRKKEIWIENKIGNKYVTDSIFNQIDKDTIKKCDPYVLTMLFKFYDFRGEKQKGIDLANNYLRTLEGQNQDLGFKLSYDFRNIDDGADKKNNRYGFWDKVKLFKLGKGHENANTEDIDVHYPEKKQAKPIVASKNKSPKKAEKKKLPFWKRVALGFSAAAMAITGISLTAQKGNKMLNEGKSKDNSYIDDITLENSEIETGITSQTRAPETYTTTASAISTTEATRESTTTEGTTTKLTTSKTTYTTEETTTSTTTDTNRDYNKSEKEDDDFFGRIKYDQDEQLSDSDETVTVENEVEPMCLGTILETLPKGLTFTEGMDGGRVGKVGGPATPADGFYVIDRAVGIENNAIDYHAGLNGNEIKENATMVHISYIQGAKTMEEAKEVIEKNKNNKNWNSNGIGQRGWIKIETLEKIYEEQNKIELYSMDMEDEER